jgi:ADP-dependent NAD(P)H-hydrate dehydratase
MSSDRREKVVTADLLRQWTLPDGGDSKNSRGSVVVVGGAARSPGAAMLAGAAALRVGAGRLTLAVAESVATQVAVALPECGIVPLAETTDGHVAGDSLATARHDLETADAVLIGPGLDDVDQAIVMLEQFPPGFGGAVLLDAFALGALSLRPELRDTLPESLTLTPNLEEAARLLGREVADLSTDVGELAGRYRATVTCHGHISSADGAWLIGTGASGLGTSGSGDVLAGAVAGFSARGVEAARAAVWGSHVHAVAGDRLAVRVGALGYLASELLAELPRVIVEVGA